MTDKNCLHCKNQGFCHVFITMRNVLQDTAIIHGVPYVLDFVTDHCIEFTQYEDKKGGN